MLCALHRDFSQLHQFAFPNTERFCITRTETIFLLLCCTQCGFSPRLGSLHQVSPFTVQSLVFPAHFPALLGEVLGWLQTPEVWNMCHYQPQNQNKTPPTLEFCVHVTSNQESDL